MSLLDKARRLAAKGKASAAGNRGTLAEAADKAERAADAKTGGRYHDKLAKARQKADEMLQPDDPASPPGSAGDHEEPKPPVAEPK